MDRAARDRCRNWRIPLAYDVDPASSVIRVFIVVDVFTRECPALKVDTGFASRRVTHVLNEVIARCGKPVGIRCDNGPELTSRHLLGWAVEWKIELRHIQPRKPTQNEQREAIKYNQLEATWMILHSLCSPEA